MSEIRVAQTIRLTPPGRGAVATLLVEGPDAIEAVGRVFRLANGSSLQSCHEDRPLFGYVVGTLEEAREEVVAHRHRDGSVELHCHGGRAAVSMIEDALVELGCRRVDWEAWVETRHEDPIATAARLALAEARTERTAAILLDQYRGALRTALDRIERAIASGNHETAREQIETLRRRAHWGMHLIRPWRLVVAGQPNVGKSSLINRLVGYRRAIVHDLAGTTRDLVMSDAAIEGWPVQLVDTAGLRVAEHTIEHEGVVLAKEAIAEANLVLLVVDAREGSADAGQMPQLSNATTLVVRNKSDLLAEETPPRGLSVSAISGNGFDDLQRAIAAKLVPDPSPLGAAVPFCHEQLEMLERLSKRLT